MRTLLTSVAGAPLESVTCSVTRAVPGLVKVRVTLGPVAMTAPPSPAKLQIWLPIWPYASVDVESNVTG
jgi:hypothetical protein